MRRREPGDVYAPPSLSQRLARLFPLPLVACLAATTTFVWDRFQPRATPSQARTMLQATDPLHAQDRANAVILVYRDADKSLDLLIETAKEDSPAGAQAKIAIEQLRRKICR